MSLPTWLYLAKEMAASLASGSQRMLHACGQVVIRGCLCNPTGRKAAPRQHNAPMDKQEIATGLAFSVIIAVFNDWVPLDRCLRSLAEQKNAPSFEVIIVDDGSREAASEFIRHWIDCYPLTIVRQLHAGVSIARNRGVQISRAPVLIFVDADCRLQINCLQALSSTISASPQHSCFQLHLTGDCSSGPVGRAEELRLMTVQNHLLEPNGCIRYLNTAGFAIRRDRVDTQLLFDPPVLRAEDTLLLANLMQNGELPLFVGSAIVQHAIPLSLVEYLRKAIRSAYLEGRTFKIVASRGVRIRVRHRERLRILLSMWKNSAQENIGRSAWFLVVAKQALQRIVSFSYRLLPVRSS